MSRIYTVSFSGTLTNSGGDADLLELLPADDKPCKLRGFSLAQTSEVGDTAEEGLRISVIRLPATVTSGNGTATTGQPIDSADSAAGFAAETNGATVATTSGTAITLMETAWNVRMSPYEWWAPDAPYAPKAKQGEGLVVRCQTTAADDISVACTFWIEEE
jgi:hypothetical protein